MRNYLVSQNIFLKKNVGKGEVAVWRLAITIPFRYCRNWERRYKEANL